MDLRAWQGRYRALLPVAAAAFAASFAGCGAGGGDSYESLALGGKTWMKKNLNIETANSWCYDNDPANCAKYGRLYTYEAAVAVCSLAGSGWRLPNRAEWEALVRAADGNPGAGTRLKSTSGWNLNGYDSTDGNGTDNYGFSVLPGGGRNSDGDFNYAGDGGYWWTAEELNSNYAYCRDMYYNYSDVHEYALCKHNAFSVRCVRD